MSNEIKSESRLLETFEWIWARVNLNGKGKRMVVIVVHIERTECMRKDDPLVC
jgi:hypothetical protein